MATGLGNATYWRSFDLARLSDDPLFAYVGAGLSRAAGQVSWAELTAAIHRHLSVYEGVNTNTAPPTSPRENSKYLQEFILESDKEGIPILSRNSADQRAFGRLILLNLIFRFRAPSILPYHDELSGVLNLPTGRKRPGQPIDRDDLVLQDLLWQTKCQGVFTTNYDTLLEDSFNLWDASSRLSRFGHMGPIRRYHYHNTFLKFLLSNPRFVLKLHGDVNDVANMILDPYEAWERPKDPDDLDVSDLYRLKDPEVEVTGVLKYQYGETLLRIYAATLLQGHMIYLGTSLSDETFIQLHSWWHRVKKESNFLRIALVPEGEIENIAENLGGRWNRVEDITFLTYSNEANPSKEVEAFLQCIANTISTPRKIITSPEARDIWKRVILGKKEKQGQRWTTYPYNLKSEKLK